MPRTTLFKALTGYEEPAPDGARPELLGGAAGVQGPALLGTLSTGPQADVETREERFPAVLAALQNELRDRPVETTERLADAFHIERTPAAVRTWLERAKQVVDESQQATLLGGPGGALIDYEAKYGAAVPAAAGGGVLGGGPDDFSVRYFRDHVVDRFREPALDLEPKSTTFQDDNILGLLGWLVFNGPGAITVPRSGIPPRERFGAIAGAEQFIRHGAGDHDFVHTLPAGAGGRTRVALFADFGTGLSHAQMIARQIAVDRYDAAVHLGDVYYTGTTKQYEEYFGSLLKPALDNGTKLFVIPDNHDGYSGFHAYVAYLRSNLPQRGSYFAIETPHVQFIGVDTIWHSERGRITDGSVRTWLGQRIAAGRAAKRTNVLLTGFGPYDVGKGDVYDLFADVAAVAQGHVDMWFWGNTHYCALFDHGDRTAFFGSCIGHAGYPYERYGRERADGSAAPVLFLETGPRFEGTNVRTDRGMNGFCSFEIEADGTVRLRYLDWRGHERCVATFAKKADGGRTLTDLVDRVNG